VVISTQLIRRILRIGDNYESGSFISHRRLNTDIRSKAFARYYQAKALALYNAVLFDLSGSVRLLPVRLAGLDRHPRLCGEGRLHRAGREELCQVGSQPALVDRALE
jgi:hypothetical protein